MRSHAPSDSPLCNSYKTWYLCRKAFEFEQMYTNSKMITTVCFNCLVTFSVDSHFAIYFEHTPKSVFLSSTKIYGTVLVTLTFVIETSKYKCHNFADILPDNFLSYTNSWEKSDRLICQNFHIYYLSSNPNVHHLRYIWIKHCLHGFEFFVITSNWQSRRSKKSYLQWG